MCSYMVKGVSRSNLWCSYVFESNLDSWGGLCKSIRRRPDVVQVKCVLMGRFMFFVGHIVCGVQGRDFVSFLTKINITGRRYVH